MQFQVWSADSSRIMTAYDTQEGVILCHTADAVTGRRISSRYLPSADSTGEDTVDDWDWFALSRHGTYIGVPHHEPRHGSSAPPPAHRPEETCDLHILEVRSHLFSQHINVLLMHSACSALLCSFCMALASRSACPRLIRPAKCTRDVGLDKVIRQGIAILQIATGELLF